MDIQTDLSEAEVAAELEARRLAELDEEEDPLLAATRVGGPSADAAAADGGETPPAAEKNKFRR